MLAISFSRSGFQGFNLTLQTWSISTFSRLRSNPPKRATRATALGLLSWAILRLSIRHYFDRSLSDKVFQLSLPSGHYLVTIDLITFSELQGIQRILRNRFLSMRCIPCSIEWTEKSVESWECLERIWLLWLFYFLSVWRRTKHIHSRFLCYLSNWARTRDWRLTRTFVCRKGLSYVFRSLLLYLGLLI